MNFFRTSSLSILMLAVALHASQTPTPSSAGLCEDIFIPVQIEAENLDLSLIPDILNDPAGVLKSATLTSLLEWLLLSKIPVSGTEIFAGTYCEPSVPNQDRNETLQLLVHGATYTRDYWMATPEHYQPEKYSWVEQALNRSYPTLAIDRIGNGLSSHPDPILAVQTPYEVRALHTLIQQIRTGSTNALPRSFSKIIYVGHSLGSTIGDNLLSQFPDDVDVAILTGFSQSVIQAALNIVFVLLLPAAVYDDQRFGSLAPGYLVTGSKLGRQDAFFYGPGAYYDTTVYDIDFATMGTISVGEAITAFTDITEAPEYHGKIFVLNGNNDEIFCASGNLDIFQSANCGTGPGSILDQTRTLFPAAATYDYYAIPNTGHCLNLHYSALDSYARVHDWLSQEGF